MDTPVKSSIRRKPNGFLMVQVKGKFTPPRPLYANTTGLLLKIGSDASNHIQIKNGEVAPFHAELRQVTFQGQSKVIIQDCRPTTNFLPILVGTTSVPSQSTMVIPQDMPNICIGSHKFVFLYTIPPMLLTMYPNLAQQEWMQYYTTPATNPPPLSQSQPTDMLSQSMELPPSNLNVVKKEEPPVTNPPVQQLSQERTLTVSSSGSINSESEPETQPNIPDEKPSSPDRSESESGSAPENATKDDPQSGFYSLNFSQRGSDLEEEEPPSKPQPKSKRGSKKTEDHESNAESTVEGIKSSDKEHLTSETSESEPSKISKATKTPKKAAPKSTKKGVKKEVKKVAISEPSEEEEQSTSELERLAKEYLNHAEDLSQSESSATEIVKKTPKKVTKTPSKPKSTGKKPGKWYCPACDRNKQQNMVDCQTCGTWYHAACVGCKDSLWFVCDSCKAQQDPIEEDSECPLCLHTYSENVNLVMITCDGCDRWFHNICANVEVGKKKWFCEECAAEGRQKITPSETEESAREEESDSMSNVERVVVDLKKVKGKKYQQAVKIKQEPVKQKEEEEEELSSVSDAERVVVDLKDIKGKGSQSAKKATNTKKMTRKAPNTVATAKSRKMTTPKKTPKKAAPVPPSDSEGQEPSSSSSDESDSDEKENVFDTFKLRQKEGQFVPKISSKFAYFKSPPMDLAKTRLQQKTSPAPKKLF